MEIRMPRLGVNDETVKLVQWLVDDGSLVENGQEIAYIESSKTSGEVIANETGVLHLLVNENIDITVGSIIAQIGDNEQKEILPDHSASVKNIQLTDKARILVDEYKIDISILPADKIIRESDILKILKKSEAHQKILSSDILLLGISGFTKIAIDILRKTNQFNVSGIISVTSHNLTNLMGIPIIGNFSKLEALYGEGYRNIFNAFSDIQGTGRKATFIKAKKIGFSFPNIIHTNAVLEPSVKLGDGNLICANSFIGSEAIIGNNCIINVGSIISHDVQIGDHSNIASGATLASGVEVGENTIIGQNVSVYMGVKIGNNVTIHNGCSIFKNISDNATISYNRQN